MMQIFRIYAKQLTPHIAVILLIALGQLAAGKMNQLFIGSATPPAAIDVYVENETSLTQALMTKLKDIPDFTVREIPVLSEKNLKTENIQGILVIPETFDEALQEGEDEVVEILVASGIQDTTAISEAISTSLIQLRSELLLDEVLEKNQLSLKVKEQEIDPALLLNIQYVNADEQVVLADSGLSIGILALFVLIAMLYGNSFLPGFDSRRLRLYSFGNLIKCQGLAMANLLLLWVLEIGVFWLGVHFVLEESLRAVDVPLLLAVLIYTLSLSLLLVNLGLRHIVSFLFVPWLLLNMTLGGGLWNVASTQLWLQPILPVAMALNGHLGLLLGCAGVLLLGSGGVVWWRIGRDRVK